MDMVHAGMARHGSAWFAHEQTAGKGQRGKTWLGKPGENIALSVALYPLQWMAAQQFRVSVAAGLACHDLFSKYAGNDTKLKWPNDLYWRDRKTGGVLIENVFAGTHWKCAMVGMGININQVEFHESLKNPASLALVTGENYQAMELALELHERLLNRFEEISSQPFEAVLQEYNSKLFRLNETVKLKKDNAVFETTVKAVNASGQLLTSDTMERTWNFGEVEWVL